MNLYKKCTGKPYSFLLIDTTLTSDNPSCFRKNLLERMQKFIMTTDDKIKDEKIQNNINREAAKLSALPSGKILLLLYNTTKRTSLTILRQDS